MTITWTIIVLGVFLPGMAYAQVQTTIPNTSIESHNNLTTTVVIFTTVSTMLPKVTEPTTTIGTVKPSISAGSSSQAMQPSTFAPTTQPDPNNNQVSTALPSISTPYMQSGSSDQVKPGPIDQNTSSSPTTQQTLTDSSKPNAQLRPFDQASTSSPDNQNTQTGATKQTTQHDSTEQPTTDSPAKQDMPPTTSYPATIANSTTQLIPSDITTDKRTNTGKTTELLTTAKTNLRSAVSPSLQTTVEPQSTTAPIKTSQPSDLRKNFTHPVYDLSSSSSSTDGNIVRETCKKLGQNLKGNCSVEVEIKKNQLIATITINADQAIPLESYNPPEINENENGNKAPVQDTIPDTLIAILASCGALVLILCGFAAYCTYHRRSYRKNQQHLTEELQTVENGYHDNPTLEVMEVQPEMQEKKLALNGEFNDSWIVPIDNLLKEDIPDEEDTHL